MDSLLQDIRYGLRGLFRNPGFAGAAVLTLALGIGANAAMFSVVDAILPRPLPYPDPDQLVMVWEDYSGRGGPEREWFSPADLQDYQEQNTVATGIVGVLDYAPNLTGGDEPVRVSGAAVSGSYFSVLGVAPVLGRAFLPDDDLPGASPVVVLSHRLWQRRFGGRADIIGQVIALNGLPHMVVGVAPPEFHPPIIDAELWKPLRAALATSRCGRGCVILRVIARLKPGISIERAGTELGTIAARLAAAYPDNTGIGATVIPLREQLVVGVRPALLVLLGAVGCVLLIVCANISNLLLARSLAREREIALRIALGAGRGRVLRQLFTESLLLAVTGGAAGVVIAYWASAGLIALSPSNTPRLAEIAMNARVLGFLMLVSLLTGLLFGLAPALQLSKLGMYGALKDGSRTVSHGRVRGTLVAAEVAVALMLLVGAGLFVKSFVRLTDVDLGFQPDHLLSADILPPQATYPQPAQQMAFFNSLLARLQATPGVVSAAAVSMLPLSGGDADWSFLIEGHSAPRPGESEPVAWTRMVTPGYFSTMGIRVVHGRVFTAEDRDGAPPVAVISEEMARRYWPGEDAVGKRLRLGPDRPWVTVVGIVSGVRHDGPGAPLKSEMYWPYAQRQWPSMTVVLRTSAQPLALAGALRSAVREIDPALAIGQMATMDQLAIDAVARPRLYLLLFGLFAAVALGLAALGIYGVTAYTVGQRTREIGIRVALGAERGQVMRLILQRGMMTVLIGLGVGAAGALGLSRVLASLVFGVSPTDLSTFVLVAILLAMVALAANYLPARRAAAVDPVVALRSE